MSYPNTQLLISGRFRDAADGRTLDVTNPATGDVIGSVAHAGEGDLEAAVTAAVRGFAMWRKLPASERALVMRRAAANLRKDREQTALALTLEQGKPLHEARSEVDRAAETIEWFADESMRVYGRVIPPRNLAATHLVVKDPVGPVAAFTPWNFPINQVVRKVSAALAAGCSIIVKAAEETPAAPAALLRAFVDAGTPEGVVGLVFGDPARISEYLIAHPAIRKISFTGSTAVGKHLAALAGRHMKRATMELGGHAPVIIAEDADIEAAALTLAAAKFRNAGQVCVAPTRFLVARSICDDFADALAQAADALRVGEGQLENVQMGPLANGRRVTAIRDLMTDALERGARVLAGGSSLDRKGHFWKPTVLADVPIESRIFNEEPFGPIAAIRSFDGLDEAIQEANRLPYGLAGYGFTSSIATAHVLSREVQVGMMWINQGPTAWPELPFVGVADSGYGSEGGPEAVEAYLNTRLITTLCL